MESREKREEGAKKEKEEREKSKRDSLFYGELFNGLHSSSDIWVQFLITQ